MKNFFHSIASFSWVIWAVGYFGYQMNNSFHIWILVATVATTIRLTAFRKTQQRKKSGKSVPYGRDIP